ncbi:hypothetical protein CQW23_19114 [Capsicum baccatum]|uniref:Uncharacterized protein n=1 Tax=Capsicum baccatum TaxID=33114 RepID=A0A2G2W4V8_CAPBA|nr:hypothetical protein CQW23_19114 [Capsicum baccatum]
MFTINTNASDYCSPLNLSTLSWNKSKDCCSWDGVHCEKTTGQVIELDLYCSGLQGKFHSNSSLFQLSNLGWIDLSYNDFSGSLISPKFGELSNLMDLDLLRLGFTGVIPAEISHLSKLQGLSISSDDPYGLRLGSYSYELLLKNLTQLRELDLDFVNISSTNPLNFSSYLTTLRLSHTQLRGVFPERVFHLSNLQYLYSSSNSLTGPIPSNWQNSPVQVQNIVLRYSKKKSVARSYSKVTPRPAGPTNSYSLSQNNFSGQISSAICNLKALMLLDLGRNHLNGTIPHCLAEMSMVSILDLSNNYLSGTINTTFNAENLLLIINLYGNKLKGKVPASLINCRYLEFLDLGNNELNDTFPSWLGGLPGLKILSLRSNKFHGPISDSRTNNSFAQIRVIDLTSNGFIGNLPVSLFENFQAMKIIGDKSRTREYVADYYPGNYANTLIVTTKGLDLELPRVLNTEVITNLSRNRFEGYLPSIIGDLVGLRTLNLSHNGLEGIIPASLHQLSVLESLDLSSNKIGGEIPQQLASLTFLAVLNLSHNHLVGCIPRGK